jgi:hypothetical protein
MKDSMFWQTIAKTHLHVLLIVSYDRRILTFKRFMSLPKRERESCIDEFDEGATARKPSLSALNYGARVYRNAGSIRRAGCSASTEAMPSA